MHSFIFPLQYGKTDNISLMNKTIAVEPNSFPYNKLFTFCFLNRFCRTTDSNLWLFRSQICSFLEKKAWKCRLTQLRLNSRSSIVKKYFDNLIWQNITLLWKRAHCSHIIYLHILHYKAKQKSRTFECLHLLSYNGFALSQRFYKERRLFWFSWASNLATWVLKSFHGVGSSARRMYFL